MDALFSTALSGMNAAWTRLGVSAHNVANLPTPGFRPQQAALSTRAGGGVDVAITRAPEPGVSLPEAIVEQMSARHAFAANLSVFKAGDSLLGTLLDLQA